MKTPDSSKKYLYSKRKTPALRPPPPLHKQITIPENGSTKLSEVKLELNNVPTPTRIPSPSLKTQELQDIDLGQTNTGAVQVQAPVPILAKVPTPVQVQVQAQEPVRGTIARLPLYERKKQTPIMEKIKRSFKNLIRRKSKSKIQQPSNEIILAPAPVKNTTDSVKGQPLKLYAYTPSQTKQSSNSLLGTPSKSLSIGKPGQYKPEQYYLSDDNNLSISQNRKNNDDMYNI
jgi:hypothetical protein